MHLFLNLQAELAKLPKPYTPKIIWKDGRFIPSQSNPESNSTTLKGVLKDCNSLHKVCISIILLITNTLKRIHTQAHAHANGQTCLHMHTYTFT